MNNQSFTASWNEQTALANVDGCVSHLKELLEIWLRQTPKLVSDIKKGLAEGDSDRIHLAAHTMKGSLQIIGADAAALLTESLEIAGRTAKISEGSELLNQLVSELSDVTAKVTAFIDRQ